MADFLIVFMVTFLVIAGVATAMIFGKSPVYQPSQQDIQELLTSLIDGQLTDTKWQFFLGMPIRHDEQLEQLRLKCVDAQATQSLRVRAGMVRLKEPGLIRVRHLIQQLGSGSSKEF